MFQSLIIVLLHYPINDRRKKLEAHTIETVYRKRLTPTVSAMFYARCVTLQNIYPVLHKISSPEAYRAVDKALHGVFSRSSGDT